MTQSVQELRITIGQPMSLPNTANGTLDIAAGNYIALLQPRSSPAAYDLYRADHAWAKGKIVGAVFVDISIGGQAALS